MNRLAWIVLAILILVHLGIDSQLPRWMYFGGPERYWVYIPLGICISQANLIALWAVFAPGALAWRLPWAMLLGMLMWGVLVVANRAVDNFGSSFSRTEAVFLGTILLGGILIAQLPLWLIRLGVRQRLYPPGSAGSPSTQFNLKQVLIGTALCCVGLALIQAVLPPSINDLASFRGDAMMWVIFSVLGTVNLLLTLPAMWWSLTASRATAVPLAVVYCVYTVVVTMLEIGVMVMINRSAGSENESFAMGAFNFAQGASVAATLISLRAAGFSWEARQPDALASTIEPASETAPLKEQKLPAEPIHPLDLP